MNDTVSNLILAQIEAKYLDTHVVQIRNIGSNVHVIHLHPDKMKNKF